MGRTKGSNPEEKFDNGAKFQISKTSSFSKRFSKKAGAAGGGWYSAEKHL